MAKDRTNGKLVAIKCLAKAAAAKDAQAQFSFDERSEELQIHSRLKHHPNIVNFVATFETDTNVYIVLEYCSMGDLYEAIRQRKGPKETEHVREFMLQLVDAVQFLHKQGISHRDIKPENIFLTERGKMKLGDFGLATRSSWSREAAVGSDRYMAPEQYDPAGAALSPAQADIWSIGICLLNILFSRNPFAVPAHTDLLFADFVRDRQSLFDVFPNMSQDTYAVLIHCLAVDPAKRSLGCVKEALKGVVSFTTDDEALDDFCTETRDNVAATANREPLRTPSITSPNADNGESFPWTKVLRMTSPHGRRLSVIEDNETISEDLFDPGSQVSTHDWVSKADSRSIDSTVDSGLGLSLGSANVSTANSPAVRSKPMPIASSLPTLGSRAGSTIASLFGRKKLESKSWSDLWEEEEEERQELERHQNVTHRPQPIKVSALSTVDSSEDGRSTPRAFVGELKNSGLKSRSSSTESKDSKRDDHISEHTGFIFDDHPATAASSVPNSAFSRPSPPARRSFIDKWSALGDRRRGTMESTAAPSKPTKPVVIDPAKRRFSSSHWRRSFGKGLSQSVPQDGDHAVWQQKEFNMSQDWRKSNQDLSAPSLRPHASQLDGADDGPDEGADDGADDSETAVESDEEWVGGWAKDLHL